MYSALSIVLARYSRHLDLTTLVRVWQRSDLPRRVCFHLVEHRSLSVVKVPTSLTLVIMLTTPCHFQQANIISVGCVLHSQVIEGPRGGFLPEDDE